MANPAFTDQRLAYIRQPFPLSDKAAVDEVIELCRQLAEHTGRPVRLVGFDSFADFYGAGDQENSATDMQRLISGMKRIRDATGATVMANAHTGWEGDHQRGSSRLRNAWDFEWEATGSQLVCRKARYGPEFLPVPYGVEPCNGTLVIRNGQPVRQESEPAWTGPEVLQRELNATESRIWQDIAAYLDAHASKDKPLSFNRIRGGVRGNDATIRQMLDRLTGEWLAGETERGGYYLRKTEFPYLVTFGVQDEAG
jgi:hypothetical protein